MRAGVNELSLLDSLAVEEARRLDSGVLAPEHFLLAMLTPAFAASAAARALELCGITRETVDEVVGGKAASSRPRRSGIIWSPACHDVVGFARGLAAGLGAREVTAEHVLLAQLFSASSFLENDSTETRSAILSTLADLGVQIPKVAMPPVLARPKRSAKLYVSLDELDALVSELPRLVPGGISWNRDDERGWIQAAEGVNLDAIIPFALDAWSRRRIACRCCGFVTLNLDEPLGERVCPVCAWIDDPVANNNPAYSGGQNGVSLADGRDAFRRDGFARPAGRGSVRQPEPQEIPPTRQTATQPKSRRRGGHPDVD